MNARINNNDPNDSDDNKESENLCVKVDSLLFQTKYNHCRTLMY